MAINVALHLVWDCLVVLQAGFWTTVIFVTLRWCRSIKRWGMKRASCMTERGCSKALSLGTDDEFALGLQDGNALLGCRMSCAILTQTVAVMFNR